MTETASEAVRAPNPTVRAQLPHVYSLVAKLGRHSPIIALLALSVAGCAAKNSGEQAMRKLSVSIEAERAEALRTASTSEAPE